MQRTRLELFKEAQKFSAGHFTIFSATERENLHGHNFTIALALEGMVNELGMFGDYRFYKERIQEHCKALNETFLLPRDNPFLILEHHPNEIHAHFDGEVLKFLKRDVQVLPVSNITVEELARYFGESFIASEDVLREQGVDRLEVFCSSGPGQRGSWTWNAKG